MLINLNEDALRHIIREAVKKNVTYKWANMDIDYPAKGRTAKKISKDEFISNMAKVYKEHCREGDDADRFDNKKITPAQFISMISWNKNAPKRLRDDLNKIEHDEENIDGIGDIKFADGIPFIQGQFGGDWEIPIFFIIYWDGKEFRGYIPTKGNSFDRFRKIALGNDDDEDIKFLKKVKYYKPDRYMDVYYNKEECLKDFKHRIGVLK